MEVGRVRAEMGYFLFYAIICLFICSILMILFCLTLLAVDLPGDGRLRVGDEAE